MKGQYQAAVDGPNRNRWRVIFVPRDNPQNHKELVNESGRKSRYSNVRNAVLRADKLNRLKQEPTERHANGFWIAPDRQAMPK